MAFMQMENINTFLLGAMALGVPKSDLFQTVDLYELKNPAQVVNGIFAFARHASKKYPSLPTLGPKLSEKHSVVFTEEQKRAGAYVPSQQTGHHAGIIAQERGATQSGMNYGQSRQIKNEKVSYVNNIIMHLNMIELVMNQY